MSNEAQTSAKAAAAAVAPPPAPVVSLWIGLDIGASHTKIALADCTGYVSKCQIDEEALVHTVPTACGFVADHKNKNEDVFVCGMEAANLARKLPESVSTRFHSQLMVALNKNSSSNCHHHQIVQDESGDRSIVLKRGGTSAGHDGKSALRHEDFMVPLLSKIELLSSLRNDPNNSNNNNITSASAAAATAIMTTVVSPSTHPLRTLVVSLCPALDTVRMRQRLLKNVILPVLGAEQQSSHHVRIVHSTTCALLRYTTERVGINLPRQERRVIVCDFGAATVSCALATIEDGLIEVLAVGGDIVGGDDIDDALAEHCEAAIKLASLPEGMKENRQTAAALRWACEKAKIDLAGPGIDRVSLPAPFDIVITREQLELLAAPIFQRVVRAVRSMMVDRSAELNDVAELVLIGGSSRSPAFRRHISCSLVPGKVLPLYTGLNAVETNACGAATAARLKSSDALSPVMSNLLAIDVSFCELGVLLVDGTGSSSEEGAYKQQFVPVVKRNAPIPARSTMNFTLTNLMTKKEANVLIAERNPVTGEIMILQQLELFAPREPILSVTIECDMIGVNAQIHAANDARACNSNSKRGIGCRAFSRAEIDAMTRKAAECPMKLVEQ